MIQTGQIGHVHLVRRITKIQEGPWAYGKIQLTYVLFQVLLYFAHQLY